MIVIFLYALAGSVSKAGKKSDRYAKRWSAPYAEDLVRDDPRVPILWLRAFDDDENFKVRDWSFLSFAFPSFRERRTLEEVLVQCLKSAGPVIAVGRPGEWAPPLGAGRLYAGDDWQQKVLELITQCRYVVVTVGETAGLAWELSMLAKTRALEKTIFVLPPVSQGNLDRRWTELSRQCGKSGNFLLPWPVPADAVLATVDCNGCFILHRSRRARSPVAVRYTEPLRKIIQHSA